MQQIPTILGYKDYLSNIEILCCNLRHSSYIADITETFVAKYFFTNYLNSYIPKFHCPAIFDCSRFDTACIFYSNGQCEQATILCYRLIPVQAYHWSVYTYFILPLNDSVYITWSIVSSSPNGFKLSLPAYPNNYHADSQYFGASGLYRFISANINIYSSFIWKVTSKMPSILCSLSPHLCSWWYPS